jgi:hypothetical protein
MGPAGAMVIPASKSKATRAITRANIARSGGKTTGKAGVHTNNLP